MSVKPFSEIGNFTTFPNEIIDLIMPICAPNTWKILCATIRKTIGWKKNEDWISITQYMKLTGIKNRTTCTNAIQDALENKFLKRTPYRNGYKYKLNKEYEICTSTETVPSNSTESVLADSTESVLTKETITKEINTKEIKNKFNPRPYVTVLASVTGIDEKLVSWGHYSKEAKKLHDAGYTASQIAEVYGPGGAWFKHDWRGQKGQKPNIKQIRETIKELGRVKSSNYAGGKFAEFINT